MFCRAASDKMSDDFQFGLDISTPGLLLQMLDILLQILEMY